MVKVTYFIRRQPGLTLAQFLDHWRHRHAPLIARHANTFGIGRYVQVHPVDDPRNQPSQAFPHPYDGIAEIWFQSREQLDSWFANSTLETRAAGKEIRNDERTFIDRAHSPCLVGEEVSIVGEEFLVEE